MGLAEDLRKAKQRKLEQRINTDGKTAVARQEEQAAGRKSWLERKLSNFKKTIETTLKEAVEKEQYEVEVYELHDVDFINPPSQTLHGSQNPPDSDTISTYALTESAQYVVDWLKREGFDFYFNTHCYGDPDSQVSNYNVLITVRI